MFLILQHQVFARGAPVRFVTEHWPPYNFLDDSGHVIGITTSKVKRIISALNLTADIEVYHWAKAIQLAEFEENVFIYSMYRSQAREERFQWICPLLNTEPVAFYRLFHRNDINITSVHDAKEYRSSVMNGDLTMKMLLEAGFEQGVNFETTLDEVTNVRKLLHGRVDLIVQEDNALRYRLNLLGSKRNQLKRLEPLDKEKVITLCVATGLKSDPSLVEKMRMALLMQANEKSHNRTPSKY